MRKLIVHEFISLDGVVQAPAIVPGGGRHVVNRQAQRGPARRHGAGHSDPVIR